MLIMLYKVLSKLLINAAGLFIAVAPALLAVLVCLAGIVILFSAVGLKVSNNLGSTIVNGVFRGFGYVVRQIVRFFRWVVVSITRQIPKLYKNLKNFYAKKITNAAITNLLAGLTIALMLLIII